MIGKIPWTKEDDDVLAGESESEIIQLVNKRGKYECLKRMKFLEPDVDNET